MAKGNSEIVSIVNVNDGKARKFYSEVISLYPQVNREYPQAESLWGKETEFIDSLKNADYIVSNKEYEVDFQKLKISFSKPIFDILFLNNTAIEFNKPIGQRLELKNYIYLELKESPIVNLNSKEDSDLFSLSKSSFSRRRYYWGYFFINEDSVEDLYYPKEVLPFFIWQLKKRLIKDYAFDLSAGIYTNFCALFKPIKYILKVRKDKEALQEKLLYRLCTDLGLIEHKACNIFKINMKQDIREIYDKTTNSLLLSNKKQYNIDSLKFYISAMENSDPCYQFLELYHSLESYFYKYFYEYIKNLKKVKTRKDFNQIQKHTEEGKMLKLVIRDVSDKFYYLENELNNISGLNSFCTNILGKSINLASWNESDKECFSKQLSKFIYSIRNNIVHTKEPDKAMVNLSENEKDVLMEINKTLFTVVKKVFDKNIEW